MNGKIHGSVIYSSNIWSLNVYLVNTKNIDGNVKGSVIQSIFGLS